MRAIRGLPYGVFVAVTGVLAGCELIANIGDPALRQPDGGGGDGGRGGATSSSSSSSSTTSSSTSSTSTSSSTGSGGAEPTCTDDTKNGNETGKDCGGGTCPACPIGGGCIVGPDCESSVCLGGTCIPEGCGDKIKNGSETDIDCGGPTCPACGEGKGCGTNSDCMGGNCAASVCAEPPSCKPGGDGLSNCGPSGDQSCCTSTMAPGGTFFRSYDGVSLGFTSQAYPATVSAFRLDKYEITVGRFRQFVAAWNGSWRPAAGAGTHTHLNSGMGAAATGGGYEMGWDAAWESNLATTASVWGDASHLACSATQATWTSAANGKENRPINCLTWYEAYAFCIWDGGFLPSEAEWNYVAAAGSEQRVYPWSSPPSSTTIGCTYANYDNCVATGTNNVGSEPDGNGMWGHADLAGNVFEWNLDSHDDAYATPCSDCANVSVAPKRVCRGGAFASAAGPVLVSSRLGVAQGARSWSIGARCARTP